MRGSVLAAGAADPAADYARMTSERAQKSRMVNCAVR